MRTRPLACYVLLSNCVAGLTLPPADAKHIFSLFFLARGREDGEETNAFVGAMIA